MKYLLKRDTLEKGPIIELTSTEYCELKNSHEVLVNAKAIEVKYDILISNYLEFEKQILYSAATNMVFRINDYSEIFEIQHALETKLINLLSSARLYIDQSKHNAVRCDVADQDILKKVKELFSTEHGQNHDYAFMEALRNYVQHRGLPIHMTRHGLGWKSYGNNELLEFSFGLASHKDEFLSDPKFNKSSLSAFEDIIDLKSTTRGYLESLSSIHCSIRKIINDSVGRARKIIEDTHFRFNKDSRTSSLCIFKISENHEVIRTPLLLDWDDIRLSLVKKNRQLVNLKKSYVSGIIK